MSRPLPRAALALLFALGCADPPASEPPEAPAPEPELEAPPPEVPPEAPARPTMAALREDATPIPNGDPPPPIHVGVALVPQVVHRFRPTAVVIDDGRALVRSGRRFSIVDLALGDVVAWGELGTTVAEPRFVDFGPGGDALIVFRDEDTPGEHLVVVGARGERHERIASPGTVGTWVAGGIATVEGELHLFSSDLTIERRLDLEELGPAIRIVASADGTLVAIEDAAGDLRVAHVEGRIVARLAAEPWERLEPLPTGGTIALLHAAGSEPVRRMWTALFFSADGSHLIAVRADGLVRIVSTDGGAEVSIPAAPEAGDVSRAALSADGSILALERAGGALAYFATESGAAIDPATVAPEVLPVLSPEPPPVDRARLLDVPTGGEHAIWHAPVVPGEDAFLLTGRFGAVVTGPETMREIHCLDGEAPIEFVGSSSLVDQGRGAPCDVRTDRGRVFSSMERTDALEEDALDDDGEYDEVEEEPEITVVRGALAVLGPDRARTRVPGTEGIPDDVARIVEVGGERLLVADEGSATRVFSLETGLVATLAAGETPYARLGGALLVTGEHAWRAVDAGGAELARIALDAGHAGVTPTACPSADGAAIAVGVGAELHLFDAGWHETRVFAMPAAAGACVLGDHVLQARTSVVEVWSLASGDRVAVRPAGSLVAIPRGIYVRIVPDGPSLTTHAAYADVIDLVEGVVRRSVPTPEVSLDEAELSPDGRFLSWPDGVHARVVRLSDGATIRLGLLRVGPEVFPYAVADDGAFSAPDAALPWLRAREDDAEPPRHVGAAETRERYFRPTLFDDFFHDRPLPRPSASTATPE